MIYYIIIHLYYPCTSIVTYVIRYSFSSFHSPSLLSCCHFSSTRKYVIHVVYCENASTFMICFARSRQIYLHFRILQLKLIKVLFH